MKKNVLMTALCFMLCLALFFPSTSTNAQSSSDLEIVYEDGLKLLRDHETGTDYSQAFHADGTEMSLEKYKSTLEESKRFQALRLENSSIDSLNSNEDTYFPLGITDMSKWTTTQKWSETMNPKKASADMDCRKAGSPCPITYTEGFTESETFDTRVESGYKEYIRVGAGYSWQTQASASISYAPTVPVGKVGYLTWAPKYNFVKGDLLIAYIQENFGYVEVANLKGTWGATPATTAHGGFADGTWAVAIR